MRQDSSGDTILVVSVFILKCVTTNAALKSASRSEAAATVEACRTQIATTREISEASIVRLRNPLISTLKRQYRLLPRFKVND